MATDKSLKDNGDFKSSIETKLGGEQPAGIDQVFGASQTRTFFENLWKQAGFDTSDMWNQRRYFENAGMAGFEIEPQDGEPDNAGRPDIAARDELDQRGTNTPARPDEQFKQMIDNMTPEARAFMETKLNDAAGTRPGHFSLEQFGSQPATFMREFFASAPQEKLINFEASLAAQIASSMGITLPGQERDKAEESNDVRAFKASVIGDEKAELVHNTLDIKDNKSTLSGYDKDDEDDNDPQTRLQKQLMMQSLMDMAYEATKTAAIEWLETDIEQIKKELETIQALKLDLINQMEERAKLIQQGRDEAATVEAEIDKTDTAIADQRADVADARADVAAATDTRVAYEEALAKQTEIYNDVEANGLRTADGALILKDENGQGQLIGYVIVDEAHPDGINIRDLPPEQRREILGLIRDADPSQLFEERVYRNARDTVSGRYDMEDGGGLAAAQQAEAEAQQTLELEQQELRFLERARDRLEDRLTRIRDRITELEAAQGADAEKLQGLEEREQDLTAQQAEREQLMADIRAGKYTQEEIKEIFENRFNTDLSTASIEELKEMETRTSSWLDKANTASQQIADGTLSAESRAQLYQRMSWWDSLPSTQQVIDAASNVLTSSPVTLATSALSSLVSAVTGTEETAPQDAAAAAPVDTVLRTVSSSATSGDNPIQTDVEPKAAFNSVATGEPPAAAPIPAGYTPPDQVVKYDNGIAGGP